MIDGSTPSAKADHPPLSEPGMIQAMNEPKIELHHLHNRSHMHDAMVISHPCHAHVQLQAKRAPAYELLPILLLVAMPNAAARCQLQS